MIHVARHWPFPPPKNYGTCPRGRVRVPPTGFPLDDKDYDQLGAFPSESRDFFKQIDPRQFCPVTGLPTGRHYPYSDDMYHVERAIRANTGLNARNDARMIGRGELRNALKTALLTLSKAPTLP